MTSKLASALYLAQHRNDYKDRRWVVHDPHGRGSDALPVIYGFNNGGPPEFLSAVAIAQDGTVLGGHCCSHEGYIEADLGIIEGCRPDRHEQYRAHYPDGYRMEFVGYSDVSKHHGLLAAIKLATEKDADAGAQS